MKLFAPERRQTAAISSEKAASCQPQAVLLSNGRYTVRFTDAGSGYSRLQDTAISRWNSDETRDADGFHIYLRDLEENVVWSAGYQPTRVQPSQYEFRAEPHLAQITRLDFGIECQLSVFVVPQHDCEVRLCRLTNRSNTTRRLEITSYLEWVLGSQEADANHPAFSKLFVETQYCVRGRGDLRPATGGQSVNTTDSAVRITHLPTGIVVAMQNEKSQLQNREAGMRVLRSRILAHQQAIIDAENSDIRKSQVRTMDRSERIRTYNYPENRIADHRTGYKAYNLDAVMNGDLDPLINSCIEMDEQQRLDAIGGDKD